jgi:hypothetical protein
LPGKISVSGCVTVPASGLPLTGKSYECMHSITVQFTQPLKEMNTRNRKIMFLGSRARPVHMADNPATIYEPIVETMWDPTTL